MSRLRDPLVWLVLVLLILPAMAQTLDGGFYVTFVTRIMILGMAAVSLNLVLGFGGMTSLGHAAFMGIGAFTVGLMMESGVHNGYLHFAAAIALGSLASLVIGAICLRTSGLSFIMLTLASAQLLYFVGSGLKQYGGDDGFSFKGRSDFGALLPLDSATALYFFVLAWLVLTAWIVRRVVNSRFGIALRGIKSNEARAISIGVHAYRYRLAAFVLAGALASVSGALLANLSQFVSPAYMHWSRSAELLLMVMLGGMSTVIGPLVGAAAFLLLEEGLGTLTKHWQAIMGLVLVVIVMYARNGLGDLGRVFRRLKGAT
ncbi:MAG: branched-chain amino acid ABC transporter permease [Betaproteobacteria bacterium]|nr:branched-chain amino acid ABC transporter permease [Betaproteobacteria bacterium]